MKDNKAPIEYLLYGNYIKYDKLSEMVEGTFKGSSATSVNLFIDIYSMIRNVHSNETFNSENELILSSSLVNLCAHMRFFFRKRYNVETKIFLIYSDNLSEYNKKTWFGYNSLQEKIVNKRKVNKELIHRNMRLLEIIIPYIPDVYFLSTDFEAGVLVYDTICYNESNGNTNPNIILTMDPYLFQIVGITNNTYIFRPKKYKSEDVSYVVSKENLLETWIRNTHAEPRDFVYELDPGLCSLLMSLSRCPERSIKTVFTIPTASGIIHSGVSEHKILNGYNSNTENIWNSLYRPMFDKFSFDMFDRRFRSIDILSQYLVYLNTNYKKIKLPNLIDPEGIKGINENYFKKFPLDLNRL